MCTDKQIPDYEISGQPGQKQTLISDGAKQKMVADINGYCAKSGSAMSESWSDVYGYNERSELIWAAKNAEDAKEHALHVLHG